MRRLINDAYSSKQPLEVFQQEIAVFEETQHAEVHADAGHQPCATRAPSFGPAHLSPKPEIHCRGGKEQRCERRIPRPVKDVAGDYEKIFSRIPGTDAPIRCHDNYKENNEGQRIEKHEGWGTCLFKSPLNCQLILPAAGVVFAPGDNRTERRDAKPRCSCSVSASMRARVIRIVFV